METNKKLCKHCKKRERVTLYYCQECREYYNRLTRELKRKRRREGLCVHCGKPSNGKRRCKKCTNKSIEADKNNPNIREKRAKRGKYSGINQLIKIL